MTAILAIDAAWTLTEPSGCALIKRSAGTWSCVALAPSYSQFLRQCDGVPVDWSEPPRGVVPDADALLAGCQNLLAGMRVDLVAIDMPVSQMPISGRREADQALSKAFGAQGCGTHSPNLIRPGRLGRQITEAFDRNGYPVATALTQSATVPRLLEVYPHPALLRLLSVDWRVAYKVSKSSRYWPNTRKDERIGKLTQEYSRILAALSKYIQGLDAQIFIPQANSLAELKRYEDALDALVCAWVGICYVSGAARPYGDSTSAIWVPEGC